MNKILTFFFIGQCFFYNIAFAHDNLEVVKVFVQDVMKDNQQHMSTLDKKIYSDFADKQTPRATVVMCSDSRVQSEAFKSDSVDDLFVVRNIGNQIRNAAGSVDYGIHFLKTPVLLIIGHSGCGAIKAAMSKADIDNSDVERELDSLHMHSAISLNDGIVKNVNQQVKFAIKKFRKLIEEKKLVVIGAIYDFQDAYKKGVGSLIVVNINGERNPAEIVNNQYLKDVKGIITLGE